MSLTKVFFTYDYWLFFSNRSPNIIKAPDLNPGPSVCGLHHPPTNTCPFGNSNFGLILISKPCGSVYP